LEGRHHALEDGADRVDGGLAAQIPQPRINLVLYAGVLAPKEGLLLLADCAERPSPGNTARVQRFYDEHTESTVRRRLRRACLEQPPSEELARAPE
jgi:hypothetical protein